MHPTPRWRLILNGKSAGDETLRQVVDALRRGGALVDVRVTWEAGDAERYVAEALVDGVDTVIAAGGDGTLSEVATSLAQRQATVHALPSLAVVPMGTANDFAAAALVPADVGEAFALIRPTRPAGPVRVQAAMASTGWPTGQRRFGTESHPDP